MALYKVELTAKGLRDCEISAHHEHGVVAQITPGEERRLYRRDRRTLVVSAQRRPIEHRAVARVEDISSSALARGDIVRGALRASPTWAKPSPGGRGKVQPILDHARQVAWLERKLASAGLAVVDLDVIGTGVVRGTKGRGTVTHNCVEARFKAEVVDAERLAEARARGIGRGKAYGLGLLLVVPCRS